MKNKIQLSSLGALCAFAAVAGCADRQPQDVNNFPEPYKEAYAYGARNNCDMATTYAPDSGAPAFVYMRCDTDPENRVRKTSGNPAPR